MNFPKITINNYNDEGNNNQNKSKEILINKKNKNQKKKIIYNLSSTSNSNLNNFNKKQTLSINIKNYNIALPILVNKVNNRKINDYKNINVNSKSTTKRIKKNIRIGLKNLYNLYHPWLNNSCNNNEINEFLSNCYDITKIEAKNNDNKYKINDSKLTNKLLRDVENHYKIANIFQKRKFKNINFNNINIKNNKTIQEKTNINTNIKYNRVGAKR